MTILEILLIGGSNLIALTALWYSVATEEKTRLFELRLRKHMDNNKAHGARDEV